MRTTNGHENNYDLMRLIFALFVIVSHSFALLGHAEPTLWGRTLGAISVHGFFVLSGFLIADSYVRKPIPLRFTVNRALRIIPALVVALIVSKIVSYMCDGFRENPVPYISNGPIWTLTWEVVCYSLVVLFGLMGVLTSAAMPVVFFVGWMLYVINIHDPSAMYVAIFPMMMMFLSGAFIRVARGLVNLRAMALPSVILLAIFSTPWIYDPLLDVIRENIVFLWGPTVSNAQVAGLIYLATFPFIIAFLGSVVRPVIVLKDDISYGVYVFAWPVSQTIVHLSQVQGWGLNVPGLLALTVVVVVPIAYLSWRWVEQPFLRLKTAGTAASERVAVDQAGGSTAYMGEQEVTTLVDEALNWARKR